MAQEADLGLGQVDARGGLEELDHGGVAVDLQQEKLLAMILDYDKLCRGAIAKGAPVAGLFVIPARWSTPMACSRF